MTALEKFADESKRYQQNFVQPYKEDLERKIDEYTDVNTLLSETEKVVQ